MHFSATTHTVSRRAALLATLTLAVPLWAAPEPGPWARALSLAGSQNILGESDFGLVNGYITLGTPYRNATAISRAFAPPYASSDFLLELWLFGERIPVTSYEWLPMEVRRHGQLRGISVSTRTVLAPARRGAILRVELRNTAKTSQEVPLRLPIGGSMEYVKTWDFARPDTSKRKTAARQAGNKVVLSNPDGSTVVGSSVPGLRWEPWSSHWAGSLPLAAGEIKAIYFALSMGPEDKAIAVSEELLAAPEEWIAKAGVDFEERAGKLFTNLPRLEASDKRLEHFYNRSAFHFLLTQWHVPEFKLHPHYGTGGVLGGTLANYLWDFGEPWELFPLYDPESTKTHIEAFLGIDLTRHFSFDPMTGKALGPFYPVNQEKIIGLIYFYVLTTGDTAFLHKTAHGKTIAQWAIDNAMWGDDRSQPVRLIDYGNGNHHLELRKEIRYDYVVPDLNGRRYQNYERAAAIAKWAGQDASYLLERAKALKQVLRAELWSPQDKWFFLKTNLNQKDLRYTVQMFKLIGSPVLDKDQEEGLLSHLNEEEFLSPFGLHSMSKKDIGYDQVDFDNGGGGCFTAFPAQIAERLYGIGRPDLAEQILSRVLWWAERTPYWGDSFASNYIEYRKDTPLQSTYDASAIAQSIMFGMFGIQPSINGEVRIHPQPPSFSPNIALRGVKLRGHTFDVIAQGKSFQVKTGGKTLASQTGRPIVLPPANN